MNKNNKRKQDNTVSLSTKEINAFALDINKNFIKAFEKLARAAL